MPSKHILIIDDDPKVLDVLRRALEHPAWRISTAETGRRGLALHRQDPADLVITDLFMPEQDGLEVLQAIRKQSPTLPLIAISGGPAGSPSMDLLPAAQRLGARHVLRKPLDVDQLLATVRELLPEE